MAHYFGDEPFNLGDDFHREPREAPACDRANEIFDELGRELPRRAVHWIARQQAE